MTCSNDTHYVIDYHVAETFELSNLIYIIASNYKLDVDRLLDICQEQGRDVHRSINQVVLTVINKLDAYEKSKLFYQYLHKQKETIQALVKYFINELPEITLSSITDHQSFKNWYKVFEETLALLKPNVHFSFNEIIKTEYMRLQASNDRALKNCSETYTAIRNARINQVTRTDSYLNNSNRTFGSIRTTFNNTTSTLIEENFNSYNSYSSSTVNWEDLLTSSGYNNVVDRVSISRNIYALQNDSVSRPKLPAKINISDEGKSRLKKSFKGLSKFLRKDEYNDLFNCNDLIVEGKQWNFRISFKSRKDIITYSENINNYSIPYNLELLTKKNNFVCSICIVYPGCPILDEILSTILLIKSGQEELIIKTGNHFNKSQVYKEYFSNSDFISDDAYFYDNLLENMSMINDIIKIQLCGLLDREEVDYIFSVDNSWDEITGYQAFNLFNVKVFDKYVNRLKWKPNDRKFNLLEKIEKLEIGESSGKNNISKLCW